MDNIARLILIVIITIIVLFLLLDFAKYVSKMQHKNFFASVCSYATINQGMSVIILFFILLDYILISSHFPWQQPQVLPPTSHGPTKSDSPTTITTKPPVQGKGDTKPFSNPTETDPPIQTDNITSKPNNETPRRLSAEHPQGDPQDFSR